MAPGSNDFTLTVSGNGFRSDSAVQWNGTNRPTTFVSSTQLTAAIPKTDVATGGSASITVTNPGVGTSGAVAFTIQFPKPQITSLSQNTSALNSPGFSLTVNGSNFFSGATLQWDGINRTTQFVDANRVTAQILTSDLAVGGNHTVRISNPSPNAGISDGATYVVSAPVPTITSITPATVFANSQETFTITGTNFLDSTKISLDNSAPLVKTNVTSTQIIFSARTPIKLGQITVTATNDGGGTASKQITLTASASGIATTSLFGPLLTDDLSENVFRKNLVLPDALVSIFTTCIGNAVCTQQQNPISNLLTPDGSPFVWTGFTPVSISADARYVAYVPNDATNNGGHQGPAFIFDGCKGATGGCTPQSIRITVPADGSTPNDQTGGGCDVNAATCFPKGEAALLSADGRYVAFQSSLSNVVLNDTNQLTDVFLRDTCLGAAAGCVPNTIMISADSYGPQISRDARFVYYWRRVSTTGVGANLYAFDTCLHATGCTPSEVQVNIDDHGVGVSGATLNPYSISSNGRFVGFDKYVRDTCLGVTTACTPNSLQILGSALPLSIAADGAYVAISSTDDLGDPSDTNLISDVFVIKTCMNATTACTQVAKRVSVDENGIQRGGVTPSFSADNQRVIYFRQDTLTPDTWVITEPLTFP